MMKADRIQLRLDEMKSPWQPIDEGKALRRTYRLPTFRAAIALVGYVAELAEAADHHPDIDIRYSRVILTLSTHSAGKVTEKDFALIAQIDQHST